MRHRRWNVSALVLASGLAACGGGATNEVQSPVAAAEPQPSGDPVELAIAGVELIEQDRCGEAIDEAFDPALLGFAAEFDDPGVQLLFARDQTMGMMRLLGAAADGQNAVLLDPVWPDTLYYKAFCLIELGDLAAAEATLRRALEMMPDDAMYLCELGHIHQTRREWTEAVGVFEQALEGARMMQASAAAAAESGVAAPYTVNGRTPIEWQTRALRGMGFSYVELGKLDLAQQVYEQALELDPNDQQSMNELRLIAELRAQGAP